MNNALEVSKRIWKALQEADDTQLTNMIAEKAVFVHMGATLSREQEINAVRSRGIVFKKIEILETTCIEVAQVIIVLNKIILTAVVDGNEVVNTFMVTETYSEINNALQLISMTYTKIIY